MIEFVRNLTQLYMLSHSKIVHCMEKAGQEYFFEKYQSMQKFYPVSWPIFIAL